MLNAETERFTRRLIYLFRNALEDRVEHTIELTGIKENTIWGLINGVNIKNGILRLPIDMKGPTGSIKRNGDIIDEKGRVIGHLFEDGLIIKKGLDKIVKDIVRLYDMVAERIVDAMGEKPVSKTDNLNRIILRDPEQQYRIALYKASGVKQTLGRIRMTLKFAEDTISFTPFAKAIEINGYKWMFRGINAMSGYLRKYVAEEIMGIVHPISISTGIDPEVIFETIMDSEIEDGMLKFGTLTVNGKILSESGNLYDNGGQLIGRAFNPQEIFAIVAVALQEAIEEFVEL